MEIITQRLVIRYFRKSDYLDVFAYTSNRNVCKKAYINYQKSPEDAKNLVKSYIYDRHLAICLNDKVIGSISLYMNHFKYYIGYVLNPLYEGNGYMNEALIYVINYCFKKQMFNYLYANCYVDNLKSLKVLDRLGFVKQGRKRDIDIDDKLVYIFVYKLSKEMFYKINGGKINDF